MVPLISDAFDDALLESALWDAGLFGYGLEQQTAKIDELFVDFCVLELVLFGVFEDYAVLLDEIEKGISPDRGDQVLLDKVISPHVLLGKSLTFLRLLLSLLLLFVLA